MLHTTPQPPRPPRPDQPARPRGTLRTRLHAPDASTFRRRYLLALGWAFTLFNSLRVFAYLPTLWAIWYTGDSSQHSLWTWITWSGANTTMALWLYEHNARAIDAAVLVNVGNASMCLLGVSLIVATRL